MPRRRAARKTRGRAPRRAASRNAASVSRAMTLRERLLAFVGEREPFALAIVASIFDTVGGRGKNVRGAGSAREIDALRRRLAVALARAAPPMPSGAAALETTPGVSLAERLGQARQSVIDLCDGFLQRAAIRASLTPDERREILRGMILTRAVDNRLKTLFAAVKSVTATRPFKGRDSDRSVRRRSMPRRSDCAAARRFAAKTAAGAATSSGRSFATWVRCSGCDPIRPRCAWCSTRRWGRPGRRWTGAICTSVISTGAFCRRRHRSRSARSR